MTRYIAPALLLLLTGCTPFSCRVSDPHALLPADSLSRAYAEDVRAYELEPVSDISLLDLANHPRTMLFSPDDRWLYVGDTRSHHVAQINLDDGSARQIEHPTFRNPYLAGFLDDTLVVLNPARRTLDYISNSTIVRQVDLPDFDDRRTLRYATVHDQVVFVKSVSEPHGSFLSRFDRAGEEVDRVELDGPYWRHAGMLRSWGDSLISLSGYRPVLDVISRDLAVDSLRLMGFDSPMLPRSRRFLLGDARDAPLLSSAASPAGDRLWVLNMRPGWIQVDAYDRDGRLEGMFTQPEPTPDRRFYPVDLIAREEADGSVLLHVLLARPNAGIVTYRATFER